jgi:hypothetical protein
METHRRLLDNLYPLPVVAGTAGKGVDYHLLCVMAIFATRDDLLAAVFPDAGGCNPQKLYEAGLGIDAGRVTPDHIKRLLPYRESFASLQRAWFKLTGYENPPCPDDARMGRVVSLTREL